MQNQMKALVVTKEKKLQLKDVPLPAYGECDALVKTISCGLCNGTDGKIIHQNFKGIHNDMYPLLLGHEAIGEVIETGSKVTSFQAGDIVIMPFTDNIEGYGSAWGAFSEYGTVNDTAAYIGNGCLPGTEGFPEWGFGQLIIPKTIDPVKAAMIITFREVLSSIKRFGIGPGSDAVIFGCGPVGLTFIKIMRLLGIRKIIALDIIDQKLDDALANGADIVLNSGDDRFADKIRSICPKGVPFVLDAVGVLDIINHSMPLLNDQGKICCYGISPKTKFELDWSDAPYNWQVQFQQFPSKKEEGEAHEQVIKWVEKGELVLDDYISDIFDFADIFTAFEKLEARQIAKKCIIKYI